MKDSIIIVCTVLAITSGLLLLNNYSKSIEYEKPESKPVINTVSNNENNQNNFVPPVVTQQPTENNSYKVFQNVTTAPEYDIPSDFTMPDNIQDDNPDINNQENVNTTVPDSILNHNNETTIVQKFSILPNPEDNNTVDEDDTSNIPNMDDFSLVIG